MQDESSIIEPFNRGWDAGRSVWGSRWAPGRYAFAPGRVEVLGNHVDYNGGPVLAAAIDRYTAVLADPTEMIGERLIEVVLADIEHALPIQIEQDAVKGWRNSTDVQQPIDFVRGVVASLVARGKVVDAGRFAVASSVPMGMGVSSSAALCVALALALSREPLEYEELVLIAQEAEHRAGTPCGTMDQSASISGGMIRFDGTNHSATRLDPDLEGHAFLVIDSGVKRSLVHSSYPRRVEECRRALERINQVAEHPYEHLASISLEELDHIGRGLDPTLLRRVRHVASEVCRVQEGEAALTAGDWKQFGQLMTESGRSSAVDYEISHEVVEQLVERLVQTPGVLGARMMGGGEGGSLIALIEPDDLGEIQRRTEAAVNSICRQDAESRSVYRFNFAPGARRGSVDDFPPR